VLGLRANEVSGVDGLLINEEFSKVKAMLLLMYSHQRVESREETAGSFAEVRVSRALLSPLSNLLLYFCPEGAKIGVTGRRLNFSS
jgi:hypothetical protein